MKLKHTLAVLPAGVLSVLLTSVSGQAQAAEAFPSAIALSMWTRNGLVRTPWLQPSERG